MKRKVTVQIGGQRYALRSDADEDTVRELAAFVDGRLRALAQEARTPDTQSQAVLLALQIAEELFAERRATAALKRAVREKSQSLLRFLEREAGV